MAELKVDEATALADYRRMCEARRINLDDQSFTEAEKAWMDVTRKHICALISSGEVSIDANNDPVFKFGNPPIKLGKANGAALLAMDGKIENARVFAALASISGMAASHFSNFDVHDINILKMFYLLFFQH